jgi:hypothetical protein
VQPLCHRRKRPKGNGFFGAGGKDAQYGMAVPGRRSFGRACGSRTAPRGGTWHFQTPEQSSEGPKDSEHLGLQRKAETRSLGSLGRGRASGLRPRSSGRQRR